MNKYYKSKVFPRSFRHEGICHPLYEGTHDRRHRSYWGGEPNFDRLYHELKVLSVTVSDPTLGKTQKSIFSLKAFFGCFFLTPHPPLSKASTHQNRFFKRS